MKPDLLNYLLRLQTMSDLELAREFRGQTSETARPIRQEIIARWLTGRRVGSVEEASRVDEGPKMPWEGSHG